MNIAILSDTHDNIENVRAALRFLSNENISVLIHCGDVCFPETLEIFGKEFSGESFVVCGNNDSFELLDARACMYKNITLFRDAGEFREESGVYYFCHFPEDAKKLARTKTCKAIFYGHTHKPWEERVNNTLLLNPGTLAGMFYRPTLALFDTRSAERKLLFLETL